MGTNIFLSSIAVGRPDFGAGAAPNRGPFLPFSAGGFLQSKWQSYFPVENGEQCRLATDKSLPNSIWAAALVCYFTLIYLIIFPHLWLRQTMAQILAQQNGSQQLGHRRMIPTNTWSR
jgi:hypothetical protein